MNDNEGQIQYFMEAILFFKELKWIYSMPVTKILFEGSLNKFPVDWLNALDQLENSELNIFVASANFKSNWPSSLINFVTSCQKLNKLPVPNVSLSSILLPEVFMKKLSVKKQHEIFHLAKLIHEKCLEQNINLIVDIGAGLGYICQLLNYLYGYQILGLESKSQNVETAKIRQKNLFPDSLSSVKYVCTNITINSSRSIEMILQQEFKETGNICLIGLHACGDLSVHITKIYLKMKIARLLILESCCYHKLSLTNMEKVAEDNDEKEYFNYFPLSENLKNSLKLVNMDEGKLFTRPFMRLACQETSERWLTMLEDTHNKHSFHVLARAVLEQYGAKNGLYLKKLVRKGTRKSQCSNFLDYLNDCTHRYLYERKVTGEEKSTCTVPWNDKIKSEIILLWENEKEKQKSVELYTALQLLAQNAAESLVLLDRLYFLKEHNCEANIIPTMDRSLSPRCYAMISSKKLNHLNLYLNSKFQSK